MIPDWSPAVWMGQCTSGTSSQLRERRSASSRTVPTLAYQCLLILNQFTLSALIDHLKKSTLTNHR